LFTGFLVREIIGKELSTRAMALSYQFLFCLVPALTLLLALLAALPGLAPARQMLTEMVVREFLAADTELVTDQLEQFIENAEVFSLVGIAILVYGTVVLISTLHGAINAIWNIRTVKVAWWQRLGPLGLVGSLFLASILLAVLTAGPFQSTLSFLDRTPLFSSGVRSFLASVMVGWLLTFLLYKLVPSTWVHTGSAAISAGVTSLLFSGAKVGFLAYAASSDTYSRIYGVLGALFLGLLWNWVAWFLILGGAALAFVLQNYEYLVGLEQRKLLGDRHRTWHGVRLVLAVYRAEERQQTPIAVSALSRELSLAGYLVDRLGDVLGAAGLISQTGSSHWEQMSPAKPAEEVSVADIARALARHSLEIPPADDAEPQPETTLRQLLDGARSSLAGALRTTTVADLLKSERGKGDGSVG
ncbi:MAG: YhjD/YihY/BrkB family envelope integrity protein, partial [Myxococcota bacterium]|nr:YhjD/YihY/BrkB family envelope integrity protein [Myxococcota bacterium]